MNPRFLMPVIFVAVIAWAIYRRARRLFGRQRVQPKRMWTRILVLGIIACVVAAQFHGKVQLLAALALGGLSGALLGYLGLRYTRFEMTTQGRFYTPHGYIGGAVAALFVGRILYDFLTMAHRGFPSAPPGPAGIPFEQNAWTLGLFGAVVGYYAAYYFGVLVKARSLVPADPQSPIQPQ